MILDDQTVADLAYEVAFGESGAYLAAQSQAEEPSALSERDKEMLEVGAAAGAIVAIARAANPFAHPQDSLEAADKVIDDVLMRVRKVEA